MFWCTVASISFEMMPFVSRYTSCVRTQWLLGRICTHIWETGEFHGRNAGASCVEAICAKRRYVIFTNFTHQVS